MATSTKKPILKKKAGQVERRKTCEEHVPPGGTVAVCRSISIRVEGPTTSSSAGMSEAAGEALAAEGTAGGELAAAGTMTGEVARRGSGRGSGRAETATNAE
jgi:hypothetical protein